MRNTVFDFFKKTRLEVEKLRDSVKQIKEDQKKSSKKSMPEPKPKEENYEKLMVHFSLTSIAKATILILSLFFLANFIDDTGSILMVFFVSIIFAAALDPTVDRLESYKIPRAISVLFIYTIMIGLMVFFFSQLVPLVARQLVELARTMTNLLAEFDTKNLPFSEFTTPAVEDFLTELDLALITDNLLNFSDQLKGLAGNTFDAIKGLFNGVFNFILVLIFTFFLTVDERGVDDFFISLFPSKHGKYIVHKLNEIKSKIGDWLRGQIILMTIIFVFSLVGFMILGVDYALTLAMIAGLAEIIPVVGPFIAAVPALLVAFNQSYWLVLWVGFFIVLLQQLEQQLVVPLVMKKAVGLSPIIVILAMLIGFNQLNVVGAIIAIPVTTILSIFVTEYATKKK